MARLLRGILVLLLISGSSVLAGEAASDPATSGIYRLTPGSAFVEGCIHPCLCPIGASRDLRGTFRIVPGASGDVGVRYRIQDLLWVVTDLSGAELRITGSGTLSRGTGSTRMALALFLNGEGPVRYEGFTDESSFPRLSLGLRIPGAACRTNGFRLDAEPVRNEELRPFVLTRDSGYDFGCLGNNCLCPIRHQGMSGPFALLPVYRRGDLREFALVRVTWRLDPLPVDPSLGRPVHGVGLYRIEPGSHRMFGSFSVGDDMAAGFDSGLQAGPDPPGIDITMFEAGELCPGQALHVAAVPAGR